jgi:hypothetical protein
LSRYLAQFWLGGKHGAKNYSIFSDDVKRNVKRHGLPEIALTQLAIDSITVICGWTRRPGR